MVAILYFLTIYGLEMLGSSTICRPWFRELLADYAYVVRFPTSTMKLSNNVRSEQSSGLDSSIFLET